MAPSTSRTYRNAMEPLVVHEVARQLQQLTVDVQDAINPDDVVAYALNSLPALYATTEAGWQWQQSRAQQALANQIAAAVRQGLMVVHQAPARSQDRLCSPESSLFDAQKALGDVATFLGYPQLSWQNLLPAIKHALSRRANSQIPSL